MFVPRQIIFCSRSNDGGGGDKADFCLDWLELELNTGDIDRFCLSQDGMVDRRQWKRGCIAAIVAHWILWLVRYHSGKILKFTLKLSPGNVIIEDLWWIDYL
jgi:hypothetical protein